jgi:hypothetical protein
MLEDEIRGRALRGSTVVCEEVTVVFRYALRPVVVRVPGSAAAYRTTRPRAETTARFLGSLHPVLERDLRGLVLGVGTRKDAASEPPRSIERIDILLHDGRSYVGCGIDVPLEPDGEASAQGELSTLSFRLRHRAL